MYKVPESIAKQILANYNNTTGTTATNTGTTATATPSYWDTTATGRGTDDGTTFTGDGFDLTAAPYTAEELANYPSPAWMEPVNNALFGTLFGGASTALTGNPVAGNSFWGLLRGATDEEGLTGKEVAKLGANALVGLANPGQIASGVPFGSTITNKASNTFLGWLINQIFGQGEYANTGLSKISNNAALEGEEGWGWTPGPTIGNSLEDPALYVGGEGPAIQGITDNNNTVGDFDNDPATAPPPANAEAATYAGTIGDDQTNTGPSFGGEDTVICTELHRQGYITTDFYRTEAKYGHSLPHETMEGYQTWAIPVVKLMRKSDFLTSIVFFFAKPILKEMAHRADNGFPSSPIGSSLLFLALPVCHSIGCLKNARNVKYAV